MANQDQIINFFHGPENSIDQKIEEGVISGSDIIITKDTDSIFYVDSDKTKHALGNSKTKEKHEVNIGGSLGGLADGTEIPAGTTLDKFIQMLTQRAIAPTYKAPAATCRTSAGTGAGNYEVGTEIKTTIQGLFTQNDAGALTSIELFKSGTSDAIISSPTSPVSSEEQTFTLGEETVSFTAKATYADGPIKDDNLGNPSPDGQVKAGSTTSSAVSFTGKRNLFYGTGAGTAVSATSEAVRALANKKLAPANGTAFTVNVATGQQYVRIAYPATLRKMTKCFYVEQNTDLAENFGEETISVQGANGAAGADYRVLTYQMAVPAASGMTLNVTL